MSQGKYLEASQELAPEIEVLSPNTPLSALTTHESSLRANSELLRTAFRRREQGWIDSMRGVEEAAVPFAGVPPIVYHHRMYGMLCRLAARSVMDRLTWLLTQLKKRFTALSASQPKLSSKVFLASRDG